MFHNELPQRARPTSLTGWAEVFAKVKRELEAFDIHPQYLENKFIRSALVQEVTNSVATVTSSSHGVHCQVLAIAPKSIVIFRAFDDRFEYELHPASGVKQFDFGFVVGNNPSALPAHNIRIALTVLDHYIEVYSGVSRNKQAEFLRFARAFNLILTDVKK